MKEERRIIVDENDEIIGSKLKSEMRFPDDIYRVSALWLMNSAGEVLLAQRGKTLSNSPGLWGPAVAGTVEVGETYETNMIKEIQEEIGVDDLAIKPVQKMFFSEEASGRRYFCQWYKAIADKSLDEFHPDLREVAELRWWPADELRQALATQPEKFLVHFSAYCDSLIAA